MNTQKQITLMVLLVFLLLGGCAAYTVYDPTRESHAYAYQQELLAERGARIFARYCRQCHGDAGTGRPGSPAPALDRPDLRNPNTTQEVQQWVSDTIMCGRIGTIMPPWAIPEGGALNNEQISDLVKLITTDGGTLQQTSSGPAYVGGHGWEMAAEFSKQENAAAPEPSVADVLKGSSITGSASKVCGQMAAGTPQAAATAPPAKQDWTVDATDNQFSLNAIAINAGQQATVTLNNKGQAVHNWEVLDANGNVLKDASGKDISMPLTTAGQSNTITFTISTPGTYQFRCQVHPTQMIGQLFVLGPGGAAGASGSATPAGSATPGAAGSTTPAAGGSTTPTPTSTP